MGDSALPADTLVRSLIARCAEFLSALICSALRHRDLRISEPVGASSLQCCFAFFAAAICSGVRSVDAHPANKNTIISKVNFFIEAVIPVDSSEIDG